MNVGGIYESRDTQSITYILDNPNLIYTTGYKVLQSQGGKGVLKCNHLTHNGKDKLVYDISRYKTLASVATVLDGVAFLNVFINLLDSIIMVKNNGFIQYDNVDLKFDNIYIDSGSYRVFLVYVPINIGQFTNDITYFEDRFRYCANEFFSNYVVNNNLNVNEIKEIVCNNQNRLEDMKRALVEINNKINANVQESSILPKSEFNTTGLFSNNGDDLASKLNSLQNTGSINYLDLNNGINNNNGMNNNPNNINNNVNNGMYTNVNSNINRNNGMFSNNINAQNNIQNQKDMYDNRNLGNRQAPIVDVKETVDISELLKELQKHFNINSAQGGSINPYDGRENSISLAKDNIKHFNRMDNNAYGGLDESSVGLDEWTDRRIREQQRKKAGNTNKMGNVRKTTKRTGSANSSIMEPKIKLVSDDESGELEFIIDKDEFTFGKNFNVVDGFIPYNEGISRVHCKIICEKGNYSLVDLGSLNGTYINGARIPSKSLVPISVGDIIGIANIEFIVEAM